MTNPRGYEAPFQNVKIDCRPYREGRGWAPGNYFCTCYACSCRFIGEKRAYECADCAYSTHLMDEDRDF